MNTSQRNNFEYMLSKTEQILRYLQLLAAWPGFAGPPARGVLVVLVQDVSQASLVIGLFRVALVQGLSIAVMIKRVYLR